MGNAVFSWINNLKTATLSASPTSVTGLGPTQLQNDQGSVATAWRTTGTAAVLTADSGVNSTVWRALCIARTNLTSAASITWTVSTPGGASTVIPGGGVVAGFGQSVVVAAADVVGRQVQLSISDPTNPDGYISIPLAHAGPAWSPLTNIDFTSTFGRDDQVDEATTRGGQEFPLPRYVRRRWNLTFAGLRKSEVWPDAMELDRVGRLGSNVLYVFDPASADINRESVFGRWTPTADISWQQQAADRRQYAAKITERL